MTDCPASACLEPNSSYKAPEGMALNRVGPGDENPCHAVGASSCPCGGPRGVADFCWWHYLLKAIAVVGLFFMFSRVSATAPGWCVALFWAVASTFLAVGVTYHAVVKKTFKQVEYVEGGSLAHMNAGRVFCLFATFVVSAACVVGLVVASASWDAWQWAVAAAAVPLFLVVYLLVGKAMRGELVALRRASFNAWASGWIVACLLCAIGMAAMMTLQPAVEPQSATDALLSAENPFGSSPSALMYEAGLVSSYADALSTYGVTKLGDVSIIGRYLAQTILSASAYLALAGFLGACALNWHELKRVFLPLEDVGLGQSGSTHAPKACPGLLLAPVIEMVVLPLLLVAAFVGADAVLGQARAGGELTPAENMARDAFGATAYVLDGKYYDQQQAQALMEETAAKSAALSEDARAELVPLVNASFDAQLANVDSYLDWYYSLSADYERLITLVTGTVESFVADQLASTLQTGVDDTELVQTMQRYVDQAATLQADYEDKLASSELVGVPEWLLTSTEAVTADFFADPIQPTQKLLETGERLGISATVGAVGGTATGMAVHKALEGAGEKLAGKAVGEQAVKVAEKSAAKSIASKVVEKAAEKSFFKAIVSRISSILASRGISTVAGGAVGALAGPAGVAAGAAAGTAIGVGVDYAALKIDEAQNREAYKAEIVEAIEEERTEALAQLEG